MEFSTSKYLSLFSYEVQKCANSSENENIEKWATAWVLGRAALNGAEF